MLEKENGWESFFKNPGVCTVRTYIRGNEEYLTISNKITEPEKITITYQTSKEILKKEIQYNRNIEKEDIEEILSLLKE